VGRSGHFDRLPAAVAPSPLWGEGWDEGWVLAITRQPSGKLATTLKPENSKYHLS